ncbi:DUF2218 domain-containing protein [Aquipseudomonas campi]
MSQSSSTFIATLTPGRYIARLCQHFAHKLPVTFDEKHGRIDFAFGTCLLRASADGLTLQVRSHTTSDLEKLQHLIASHFERFAWQALLTLEWR